MQDCGAPEFVQHAAAQLPDHGHLPPEVLVLSEQTGMLEAVLADQGCDGAALVAHIEATSAKAVIPSRRNRTVLDLMTSACTSRATISNAASTDSNSSAASPRATANRQPPSDPSSA